MTGHDLTPAEQWHATSDHGKDGEPFGGALCNCDRIATRATELGWTTHPDAARARQTLAVAAETASISRQQHLIAIATVYAQLAIAEGVSAKPDDVVLAARVDSAGATERVDVWPGRTEAEVLRDAAQDAHHLGTVAGSGVKVGALASAWLSGRADRAEREQIGGGDRG